MKKEKDLISEEPLKKMKFMPKIPPRKLPKPAVAKIEVQQDTNNDVIDKQLLAKLNSTKSNDGFQRGMFKNDKKGAQTQVAFGYRDPMKARSFGNPKGSFSVNEYQGSWDVPVTKVEKEYVEPFDYNNCYYPITLPLRRPYSGDPEILDEQEFGESSTTSAPDDTQNSTADGEVSTSSAPDDTRINTAVDLGLMEETVEPQMIFLQLPANLPLWKRPAVAEDVKVAENKKGNAPKKGCKLEDLPAGVMGKLLVYKSGAVKMKLGDALFDVSSGVKCNFAQDVAAINTNEKHCCILGDLNKRAVITPDVDSLLASIENAGI